MQAVSSVDSAKKEPFLEIWESYFPKMGNKGASWLASLRQSGLAQFSALDFPTPKLEDWKYTHIDPVLKNAYRLPSSAAFQALDLKPYLMPCLKTNTIVFLDGFFSKELSSVIHLPKGAHVSVLSQGSEAEEKFAGKYLLKSTAENRSVFTALNTAFLEELVFIHLEKNVSLEEPIQVLRLITQASQPVLLQPRALVVLEEGAQATLIESFMNVNGGQYFTNAVTEITLGENSHLEHYGVQRESLNAFHLASVHVKQEKHSRYFSYEAAFGAALSRKEINVDMSAESAHCELDGLYLVGDAQHTDFHTMIDHQKPKGQSRQFYKGVLNGKGRAVFNGKVFVRQEAPKTDAQQTNKNLVLSDEATVDTKPQLEIMVDDVKCTHGAAVGQLDEEAVFYLKSRGIGEDKSRGILTYAFTGEIADRFKLPPVRVKLDQWIWEWLEKQG